MQECVSILVGLYSNLFRPLLTFKGVEMKVNTTLSELNPDPSNPDMIVEKSKNQLKKEGFHQ